MIPIPQTGRQMLTAVLRSNEVSLLCHAVVHVVCAILAFPEATRADTLVLLVVGVDTHAAVLTRDGGAVVIAALWCGRALWIVTERGAAAACKRI